MGSDPEISIVVPTFREADNLRPLVTRVSEALSPTGIAYEIIFSDDNSGDGSEKIIAELAACYPVRILVRTENRDLSLAVLDGLRAARGEYVLVMDADLSHPPEQIPDLIAPLREGRADFTLGSRYVAGGSTHNWGGNRRLNSWVATALAKPLSKGLADSMSGFFALRRSTFESAHKLDPIGYKIGLELLCRCDIRRPMEIPIRFHDRVKGESKLNLEQQARYLIHLKRLYRDCAPARGLLARPFIGCMLGSIRLAQRLKGT
jgi:dolichol-phosphate mannosyltransferase